ncbi:hypothetical protein AB0J89_24915 [Micromonospora chokoriensis]
MGGEVSREPDDSPVVACEVSWVEGVALAVVAPAAMVMVPAARTEATSAAEAWLLQVRAYSCPLLSGERVLR